MDAVESREVQVAAIHDVVGAGLEDQQVEDNDVVQFAVAEMNKCGNGAPQIEQRVLLDRRLGRAKRRPVKNRQAEIDGGRVQRIHGTVEFQIERFVGIQQTRLSDQHLGKLEVNAEVAALVGVRQCRALERCAEPHVIELAGLRRQTHFDVAQTFSIGELRKRHDAKLLCTRQCTNAVIAVMTLDDALETRPR